jgi:hypothetical protein
VLAVTAVVAVVAKLALLTLLTVKKKLLPSPFSKVVVALETEAVTSAFGVYDAVCAVLITSRSINVIGNVHLHYIRSCLCCIVGTKVVSVFVKVVPSPFVKVISGLLKEAVVKREPVFTVSADPVLAEIVISPVPEDIEILSPAIRDVTPPFSVHKKQ